MSWCVHMMHEEGLYYKVSQETVGGCCLMAISGTPGQGYILACYLVYFTDGSVFMVCGY